MVFSQDDETIVYPQILDYLPLWVGTMYGGDTEALHLQLARPGIDINRSAEWNPCRPHIVVVLCSPTA